MEIITISSGQTRKAGKILAKKILKKGLQNKSVVLALEGNLGGGKTTFLQGFARGLGVKEKVLSPTFITMRKFKISLKSTPKKFKNFYHFDCYRIKNPKEILDLGFKKIISNSKNIVAIEWADKIRKILPRNTHWLKFQFINKNTRAITYRGRASVSSD